MFKMIWLLSFLAFTRAYSMSALPVKSSAKTVISGKEWAAENKQQGNKFVSITSKKFTDFELSFSLSGQGSGVLNLDDNINVILTTVSSGEPTPESCGAVNGAAPISEAVLAKGTQNLKISFQKLPGNKSILSVWLNGKLVQKELKSSVKNQSPDQIKFELSKGLKISEVWTRPLVNADHRSLISGLDEKAFKRGEQIYNGLCITCHGTESVEGNMPTALRFHKGEFKNGSDILSMYDSVTKGFNLMVAQTWMKPQQVYDVVHYIQQKFVKPHNPKQFVSISEKYIQDLPLPKVVIEGNKKDRDDYDYRDRKVYLKMDYGHSLSYTYQVDNEKNSQKWNIAYKGVAQRLDEGKGGVTKGNRWLVFEKDTFRIAAAWQDDFIDYRSIMFDGSHQTHPKIKGDKLFIMPNQPAWAKPGTQDFSDPRLVGKDGIHYGPLPKDWGQYLGRYIFGKTTVLKYRIGDAEILEKAFLPNDKVFARTLNISKSSKTLLHRIAPDNIGVVISKSPAELVKQDGFFVLKVPAGKAVSVNIYMAKADFKELEKLASTTPEDLTKYTKGGPDQWKEVVNTKVKPGSGKDAYTVDEITVPHKNPWKSWMRLGGFDFFKDADKGAICTWDGDVWTFSGLSSGNLKWKRMATGLFQPLGLKIVNERIFITCRDQITLLHDYNNDGEADYYECFNGDNQVTDHFHEFAMGLQTDAEGNFYYAKSARHAKPALVPHHGTLIKVSKDGKKCEILANGFRAANGICLNPDGSFLVTDQEGHWTPKNRINWVIPDVKNPKFYGNFLGYHDKSNKDSDMEKPLVWVTQKYDRSPSELIWVKSPHWGPLQNCLLNISYGFGRIHVVPIEKAKGEMQGGLSPLRIPELPTGIMRGRFHPLDGQLYTAGLFAWASSRQERPGGFYRIRYTGKEVMQPLSINATRKGLKIKFTAALASDQDFSDISVSTWHIERKSRYGSKHENEKKLKIESIKILPDKQTMFIKIADIAPTRGMEIHGAVKSASGKEFELNICYTVNSLSD